MIDTKYRIISIIGDGGMATVLAMLLSEKVEIPPKAEIRMWGYDRQPVSPD